MFPFLVAILFIVGLNTLLWSAVGVTRVIADRNARSRTLREPARALAVAIPTIGDVAVVIAAHNEELILGDTVTSLCQLVPGDQVFVISDGSTDATAAIARTMGATVLDLRANRGKAGAIVEGLRHFDIASRFEVVLLLDADTHLASDYFETGLRLFDSPEVVAVAGRAMTLDSPRPLTALGRLLTTYRNRVYIAMQYLFKFGQAARYANVVSIVPGFASMYRSRILASIDIDAPGLRIEDYNMTFEVHAKQLGRIAFHPHAATALTQDPDRVDEYVKQVERWNLGFWQTVRRHPFQMRKFWFALSLFILELLLSSALLILFLPALALSALAWAIVGLGLDVGGSAELVGTALPPLVLVLALFVPDYLLSVLAAIVTRQPRYLAMGLVFPAMRILDAVLCMRGLTGSFLSAKGHGPWQSPRRRAALALPADAKRADTRDRTLTGDSQPGNGQPAVTAGARQGGNVIERPLSGRSS